MSTTMIGIFLAAIAYIAKASGLDIHIDEGQVQTTITTIATVIGLGIAYFGRVRKGDITWYGKRITDLYMIDTAPPTGGSYGMK
jgi:hypothetical protein